MEPEPIEELDDKEQVGADPAEQTEPKPAAREDSGNSSSGAAQSGTSGDRTAAARQASKRQSPGNGSVVGGAKSGGAVQNAVRGMSSKLKKRIVMWVAAAAVSALLGIAGFFGLLAFELVDFEANIVKHFDNRAQHSLDQRAMKTWVDVRDDKGVGSPSQDHPIKDADGSFNEQTLEADLGVTIEHDGTGNWKYFVTPDGTKINADNQDLLDPNSPVETKLNSRFPTIDFYHLNARSRLVDANFGIVRKFLASQDEAVPTSEADIQKDLDQKLQARIDGTDSPAASDSLVKQDEDAAKVEMQKASDAVTVGETANGAVGITVLVCAAQQVVSTISKYAPLIREAALMRYAFVTLSTADQLKRGDLHPTQLAAFMGLLSGFEKSGGWQRITTTSKHAPIANLDDLSLNPSKGGTVGRAVSAINAVTNKVPGLNAVCGVVTSKVGLGISGVAAALTLFGAPIADIATEIAKFAGFTAIIDELTKVGTDLASNSFLSHKMPAEKVASATIAGYDSYSQVNSRNNGGERLTAQQVSILDNTIAQEERGNAMHHSLAYRLLNPDYTQSLISQLINTIPITPSQLATSFNSKLMTLFNPVGRAQLSAINGFISGGIAPAAYAYTAANDDEDTSGFGVPQYGLPDSLLNKYPQPQVNEEWVINYLASNPDPTTGKAEPLFDPGTPSSSELTDQNNAHEDLYHDFVRECLTSVNPNGPNPGGSNDGYLNDPVCDPNNSGPSDSYDHFRVYRLDLLAANMVTSYNNSTNDQNPNAGAGNAGGPNPGGGSSGYQNPFAKVTGLTAGRMDQGVDYSGSGSIVAMGGGKVVNVNAPSGSGWGPNNIYISYTLTDGKAAGKTVYFSEHITPSVHVTQTLTAGDVIGNMTGGIEVGWSQPSGDLPMAPDLADCSGASSNGTTSVQADALAVNFSDLLKSMNVAPGTYECGSGTVHGALPAGWPTW